MVNCKWRDNIKLPVQAVTWSVKFKIRQYKISLEINFRQFLLYVGSQKFGVTYLVQNCTPVCQEWQKWEDCSVPCIGDEASEIETLLVRVCLFRFVTFPSGNLELVPALNQICTLRIMNC